MIVTTAPYLGLYFDMVYADEGMVYNSLYDFQLQSQNSLGTGPFSTTLQILTPKVPGAMAAPAIATADITPTKIKITWTALTTATETGNCSVSGYLLEVAP